MATHLGRAQSHKFSVFKATFLLGGKRGESASCLTISLSVTDELFLAITTYATNGSDDANSGSAAFEKFQMDTQKSQPVKQESTAALDPAITSCRRKKKDDATFLEDLKDHIDEFIHASMDEHKDCFTKTMKKMFRMSKIVAERSGDAKEVESSMPLQTTVAK
ncbi:hypothetical protein DKX38_006283 [Salix brachista]|uniref:Uncharacterized protein n=1 Tax=Salix brachista TaxID=2182728 RepID=A0A5N5N4Z7_9ROSI|nr:hypothetical protein DKX38_006283 [Salix brachista]